MTNLLYQRLLDREHSYDKLSLLFTSAATSIQQKPMIHSHQKYLTLTTTSANQTTNSSLISLTIHETSHVNKFATSTNLHANQNRITSSILLTTKRNVS
mmetsp:Transcript_30768/g.36578  ORF Transcript_30768/g.36578 Transcript_30768/m.36578 type:complete len:99 (-) Transcript_30768:77-373(-)